mmetsp:Transcript_65237/g.121613  ORF Transcript_65237/g.121613 Transcript_65237/m.121613 type:complete len:234 (-) Transcript_65237:63-764(-)
MAAQELSFFSAEGTDPESGVASSVRGLNHASSAGFSAEPKGSMEPLARDRSTTAVGSSDEPDFENEPPILEELGIDPEKILLRMKGIAMFQKVDEAMLQDADLGGPLLIGLALGVCQLLAGKIEFGYIYGLGATGCTGVFLLINAMSPKGLDLYRTMSILGYGLIPIVLLAFVGIFANLTDSFGAGLATICILWSTATSSRFFATAIAIQDQRWLVAYPVALVYTCFALITIF